MALMQMEFFSDVLGLSCSANVIVPQRGQGPYPVLYLLHGASDNHTQWLRSTGIERYVADLGLIVVMPAVQLSFYTDQKHGLPYFTFVADELPQLIRHFFPASRRRADTFAAGLSMGGYGAFKLGIRRPDAFAAVASLSGSVDQRGRLVGDAALPNTRILQQARNTFGTYDEYDRSDNDLAWVLERHLKNDVVLPRFYLACGTDDHNWRVNVAFHERFRDRIDLTWVEDPGRGHDWGYWDETIQKVLAWLPLEKPPAAPAV